MKKLNDNGSGTGLVLTIFTSLVFSTIMISWFMLQIYGVSIAGIDLGMKNYSYASNQDFTTNQINPQIIQSSVDSEWIYQAGVGRVLNYIGVNGFLSFFDLSSGAGLYFTNIKSASGLITNNYIINNSVQGEYSIILNTNAQGAGGKLIISSDGVYKPEFFGNAIIGSSKVINYADMQQIEDVTIKTVYNENENTVDFTFNGNTYTIPDIQKAGVTAFDIYYAGVESKNIGFTIETFNTDSLIQVSQDADAVTMFYAFVVVALKLVFYNISPDLLPWQMNILLIKTQTVGLLIGIYSLIRSGA